MPIPAREKRTRREIVVAAVYILAFAAALLVVLKYPLPPVHDDAVDYLSITRHVIAGYGYAQDDVMPAMYRPPWFYMLLGGWFFLNGTSFPLSAELPDWIRLIVSARRPGGKRG